MCDATDASQRCSQPSTPGRSSDLRIVAPDAELIDSGWIASPADDIDEFASPSDGHNVRAAEWPVASSEESVRGQPQLLQQPQQPQQPQQHDGDGDARAAAARASRHDAALLAISSRRTSLAARALQRSKSKREARAATPGTAEAAPAALWAAEAEEDAPPPPSASSAKPAAAAAPTRLAAERLSPFAAMEEPPPTGPLETAPPPTHQPHTPRVERPASRGPRGTQGAMEMARRMEREAAAAATVLGAPAVPTQAAGLGVAKPAAVRAASPAAAAAAASPASPAAPVASPEPTRLAPAELVPPGTVDRISALIQQAAALSATPGRSPPPPARLLPPPVRQASPPLAPPAAQPPASPFGAFFDDALASAVAHRSSLSEPQQAALAALVAQQATTTARPRSPTASTAAAPTRRPPALRLSAIGSPLARPTAASPPVAKLPKPTVAHPTPPPPSPHPLAHHPHPPTLALLAQRSAMPSLAPTPQEERGAVVAELGTLSTRRRVSSLPTPFRNALENLYGKPAAAIKLQRASRHCIARWRRRGRAAVLLQRCIRGWIDEERRRSALAELTLQIFAEALRRRDEARGDAAGLTVAEQQRRLADWLRGVLGSWQSAGARRALNSWAEWHAARTRLLEARAAEAARRRRRARCLAMARWREAAAVSLLRAARIAANIPNRRARALELWRRRSAALDAACDAERVAIELGAAAARSRTLRGAAAVWRGWVRGDDLGRGEWRLQGVAMVARGRRAHVQALQARGLCLWADGAAWQRRIDESTRDGARRVLQFRWRVALRRWRRRACRASGDATVRRIADTCHTLREARRVLRRLRLAAAATRRAARVLSHARSAALGCAFDRLATAASDRAALAARLLPPRTLYRSRCRERVQRRALCALRAHGRHRRLAAVASDASRRRSARQLLAALREAGCGAAMRRTVTAALDVRAWAAIRRALGCWQTRHIRATIVAALGSESSRHVRRQAVARWRCNAVGRLLEWQTQRAARRCCVGRRLRLALAAWVSMERSRTTVLGLLVLDRSIRRFSRISNKRRVVERWRAIVCVGLFLRAERSHRLRTLRRAKRRWRACVSLYAAAAEDMNAARLLRASFALRRWAAWHAAASSAARLSAAADLGRRSSTFRALRGASASAKTRRRTARRLAVSRLRPRLVAWRRRAYELGDVAAFTQLLGIRERGAALRWQRAHGVAALAAWRATSAPAAATARALRAALAVSAPRRHASCLRAAFAVLAFPCRLLACRHRAGLRRILEERQALRRGLDSLRATAYSRMLEHTACTLGALVTARSAQARGFGALGADAARRSAHRELLRFGRAAARSLAAASALRTWRRAASAARARAQRRAVVHSQLGKQLRQLWREPTLKALQLAGAREHGSQPPLRRQHQQQNISPQHRSRRLI